ncbi:MAG: class I SAM-dependent methyltransferase [Alphaproteobacteria bacterium]|tara:strand:- start:5156 stop:6061 length:906 start_codon:yes stop_codon:yes gene_type:complete
MSKQLPNIFKSNFFNKIELVNGVWSVRDLDDYCENFHLQWKTFAKTQFDSYTGLNLTYDRFKKNTLWKESEMKGKKILEIGSGAGRFTEIFKKMDIDLTTCDLSKSIFVNKENNKSDKINFVRCSIEDLPFKKNYFDYIFCYGVLQHCKDGKSLIKKIVELLKKGGRLSLDWYKKYYFPYSSVTTKYLFRPITTRLSPETLLKIISFYIPKWIKIDTFIKNLPYGNIISGFIPVCCYNYFYLDLNDKEKLKWSIMDTFDALGAKYDKPINYRELNLLAKENEMNDFKIHQGSNGWVLNLKK